MQRPLHFHKSIFLGLNEYNALQALTEKVLEYITVSTKFIAISEDSVHITLPVQGASFLTWPKATVVEKPLLLLCKCFLQLLAKIAGSV